MAATSWTLLPVEGPAKDLQDITSIEYGLSGAMKHLRARSSTGHKERADMDALQKHTGETYAQVEAVPDEVFLMMRDNLHGVTPVVLLPPGTSLGPDGICLLMDTHAAIKGLPANKRGSMLLNACGVKTPAQVRGDCFLAQFVVSSSGTLSLGAAFTPEKVSQRDWLEAAQKAIAAGPNASATALETALVSIIDAARRQQIEQAFADDTAKKAADAAAKKAASKASPTAAAGAAASAAAGASEPAAGGSTDGKDKEASAQSALGDLEFADNEDDVSASWLVPAGTKAKHVKVTFRDETLRVEVLTLPKEHTVVVDGTLFQEISAKDCTWAIEDVPKAQQGERKLVLSLEKKKKMRWLMLMRS